MPTRSIGQNGKPLPTGTECFAAMQDHHARRRQEVALRHAANRVVGQPDTAIPADSGGNGNSPETIPVVLPGSDGGDFLYGAKAIARFMFPVDFTEHPTRSRRRVFNLWAFYEKRQERSGFFKLKGALCLSKKQWRKYHGLD